MNRRWIKNDAECRMMPDADAGFEVEVVSASDYDRIQSALIAAETCIAQAIVVREAEIRGYLSECDGRSADSAVEHDGHLVYWRDVLSRVKSATTGE